MSYRRSFKQLPRAVRIAQRVSVTVKSNEGKVHGVHRPHNILRDAQKFRCIPSSCAAVIHQRVCDSTTQHLTMPLCS